MDELLAKIHDLIATVPDHALAAELVIATVLSTTKEQQRSALRDGARRRKQRQRTARPQSPDPSIPEVMSRVTFSKSRVTSPDGSPLHPPPDLSSRILSSDPDPDQSKPQAKKTRPRRRHEYSEAFERAWNAYPRRDEKSEAYAEWGAAIEAIADHECLPHEEAEEKLIERVRRALAWQVPLSWSGENWKFAPYFKRYLKRRKYEDAQPVKARPGPPPPPPPPPGGFCVGHADGANVGLAVTPVIQRDTCPECRRVEAKLRQSWKEEP